MDYEALAKQYGGSVVPNKTAVDYDALAKQYGGVATPDVPPATSAGKQAPPSTLDVISSAPYEALGSTADLIYGTPQNVYNLLAAGYGTGAVALGRPDLAPEVQAPPTPFSNFLREYGLIRNLPNMTPGQGVLSTGLQSATLAALSPVEAGKRMALNALTGFLGGATGEATTRATGSPTAGLLASAVIPSGVGAAQARRQQVLENRQVMEAQNAVRNATIRAAQQEGYVLPPGNVAPTAVNRALEQIAGKTELQQIAASRNQRVTDSLARRAVGLEETADLTPATMSRVRSDAFDSGYKPIQSVGKVQVDNDYLKAMQNIEQQYTGATGSFPQAVPDTVKKIINENLVNQFDAKDALQRIRSLRDESSAAFRRGDNNIALANRAVANALEDQIERHITQVGGKSGADMLTAFRDARKRMAISHTIEDAIREGTGSVDAKKLASALNRGVPLSGDLLTAGKFASAFPNVNAAVPGTIGTPGVSSPLFMTGTTGGLGLGIGLLTGSPTTGTAAALASAAAKPLTQRYLLSRGAQRRILPSQSNALLGNQQAMNPYLYNALIGLPVVEQ